MVAGKDRISEPAHFFGLDVESGDVGAVPVRLDERDQSFFEIEGQAPQLAGGFGEIIFRYAIPLIDMARADRERPLAGVHEEHGAVAESDSASLVPFLPENRCHVACRQFTHRFAERAAAKFDGFLFGDVAFPGIALGLPPLMFC